MTLREHILDGISEEAQMLDVTKNPDKWQHKDGKPVNAQWGREATPEERKAVEAEADLELKAAQKALEIAGEAPLTPQEAKELWETERDFLLMTGNLVQIASRYQRRQEKLENCQYPNLYKKALLDSKVEGKLAGLARCNAYVPQMSQSPMSDRNILR